MLLKHQPYNCVIDLEEGAWTIWTHLQLFPRWTKDISRVYWRKSQ
jgi:hypothetical protein